MRLGDLGKWGIPSQVIERWRKRQGENLLPVQSRAIRKGLIGTAGESLTYQPVRMLISAPTSSGKSFCAELAAMRAISARQKTVMLFPLKALAEEKYRLLKETYEPLGIKCLIVTGDHPENDRAFAEGDYRIAVVIYEKFDLLLTSALDSLKNIGLVVIDEIQTVSEPGRGAVLERLLTKILASGYEPSLLGLSAVIGDSGSSAGKLAEWLKATLVEETVRPVELMRGVAAEGSFHYRLFNSGLDGSEPFALRSAGDDPFAVFMTQVKKEGGSTLVFLKSRQETIESAFKLAASVDWPEAKNALRQLDDEEPSYLLRSLRQVLSRGVAFHNADLSIAQRNVVEQAFIDKEVRVIFSTTTLAMGVNIFADNVYLETVKYSSGRYDSRPALIPVSRAEFENMTGRAGRLTANGKLSPTGRAVIWAESEFDREILWNNYIAVEQPELPTSAFESLPLADWLLPFIVSGLIRENNLTSLAAVFQHSWYAALGNQVAEDACQEALAQLIEHSLVASGAEPDKIQPTALGKAVAGSGLSVAEAKHYEYKLTNSYPEMDTGWLALALSSPWWHLPPGILSRFEQRAGIPLKMLYRHFDYLAEDIRFLLGDNFQSAFGGPLSYRQAASLKALLLLEQWRHLTPVQQLEAHFQMHLGQISYLGETAGHLIASIAEMLTASDQSASGGPLNERLKNIAFTLRLGLPVEFKPLYEQFGTILTRADFINLHKAGITTLAELYHAAPDERAAIITSQDKLNKINERLTKLKEEVSMEPRFQPAVTGQPTQSNSAFGGSRQSLPVTGDFNPAAFLTPELIEIDGTFERERYLVKINGFPVRLTGKSFKYLAKLAWFRVRGDNGWTYKDDIECGFNQARYLYRMKGEISDAIGVTDKWPIVENNRLGYYRLNIDPSKIRINLENLKNHPDYELRSLVGSPGDRTVN